MTAIVVLAVCLLLVAIWWVKSSKRRLFSHMVAYVNSLQVGVYRKLASEYCKLHGEERGKLLAAAVANRLFAKPSRHVPELLKLAEDLACEIVKNDQEVRYASLMSLRVLMVTESDRQNLEATRRIMETVQWMKQFWELPPEAPDPQLMERLAAEFYAKYS